MSDKTVARAMIPESPNEDRDNPAPNASLPPPIGKKNPHPGYSNIFSSKTRRAALHQCQVTAAETQKVMIEVVRSGHLPTIANWLGISVSDLNRRIALFGLGSAKVAEIKGVSEGLLHGTMVRCDLGPDPNNGNVVPAALKTAEEFAADQWVEIFPDRVENAENGRQG